ncbi:MAG: preprotein translocase subunit SecG [Candidatus Pacebacteria bacterium CG_4_10_14_3_um_filter_34_15]|nr:preprotein translocase subunit SecG [Candidatus Pacearchaeota archaeon]NCQ65297.1 preprotein translocase subunit SecG [Candidatus Paceibacterota bacterium]OIO44981.1 MAG: preprotein translocase subunit SecG [Candidatus Pacebacteria bacterium CG1_02_43_31]PIQ81075.1 MAG: preprotein translocase subunit SecG [Candidatus Pacebacteria bacterium CG11_big_fil_rev_8_21_14_0_20_34_55]PIX81892.1 MAG: preprotein translocase subunit SecG [Candidatus Pacebacteria bacterium CG_4_10_14_3_um_filter_34_15]P
MNNNIWLIIQSVLSVLIVVSILLQSQGSGLGSAWGGGGETYHTKRGVEKVLFNLTIVFVVLFAVTSIASLLTK